MTRYISFIELFLILFLTLHLHAQEAVYNQSIQSTTILKTDTTTAGQSISEFFSHPSEVTGLKVVLPPGTETGWHKHTAPGFAYILKGTLTVKTESGSTFEFKEGQSFAEVINIGHNGINNGKDTVELIAYFVGEKHKPITIKQEPERKNK
jgi:quercetin dioxygenase-like cupin family protein